MKLLKEYIKILINESPKTSWLSSTGDKSYINQKVIEYSNMGMTAAGVLSKIKSDHSSEINDKFTIRTVSNIKAKFKDKLEDSNKKRGNQFPSWIKEEGSYKDKVELKSKVFYFIEQESKKGLRRDELFKAVKKEFNKDEYKLFDTNKFKEGTTVANIKFAINKQSKKQSGSRKIKSLNTDRMKSPNWILTKEELKEEEKGIKVEVREKDRRYKEIIDRVKDLNKEYSGQRKINKKICDKIIEEFKDKKYSLFDKDYKFVMKRITNIKDKIKKESNVK